MLEPNHRAQIEEVLGRVLEAVELLEVESLNELSTVQIAVANELAGRQLVLCTLYLRAITSVTLPEATRFIGTLQLHRT
jgi:hypothetical protein